MPFNKCEAVVEFARSADPESQVFAKMSHSQKTITNRAQELYEKVLQPKLKQLVEQSLDESTDSSTKERIALYVRFADLSQKCIVTKFLE